MIDLSIGSPDLPPSLDIREAVSQTALKPWSYGYSLGDLPELRRAAQSWYYGRYGVLLDPERELLGLSGAQDGLVHFLLAFTEPGDKVLVPDPCFPAVMTGVRLPEGIQDDRAFVLELLARSGVLLAPGSAFGSEGRGRVRASLMCREPALREAARRIGESGLL